MRLFSDLLILCAYLVYTGAVLSTDQEHNVNVLFSFCIKYISPPPMSISLDCKEQTFFCIVEVLPWVGMLSKIIWVLLSNTNTQSPETPTL